MLANRFNTLLCASLAFASGAAAQTRDSFVVQLRLPARDVTRDVFAWRTEDGVEVQSATLADMGLAVAPSADRIALSAVEGLSFTELPNEGAIVLACTSACYARQHIDLAAEDQEPQSVDASASGGYLNYEANLQWIEGLGAEASGIVEGALFGRWGLIESSWLGQSGEDARVTRLETTWTIDNPRRGIRARVGDSVLIGATGTPIRFGGLQIGRHFGLTPSLITYPTPAFTGEAEQASTVELYVDGVLRAQSEVAAGPFVIDHAPVVSGAGEAELVITDILGRQQAITRPFFVSTAMLRRGLSDWSIALGAERRAFGRDDARYGDSFAAVRYRYGLTNALTLEAAAEGTDHATNAQLGASFASVNFGQAYVSRAQGKDGGYTAASWAYDGRAFTLGVQFERRDGTFAPLGRDRDDTFQRALAGNVSVDMAQNGSFSLTAAEIRLEDDLPARTLTFSYTPDFGDGMLSFRAVHTERETSDLALGVSVTFSLAGDASGHASAEHDRRGMTYRASVQRAVEPDRMGWRARGAAGASERLEVAAMTRSALGDTMAEAGVANGVGGVRMRHAGSVGWIESVPFAGRRIDGAFAVVDGGAPNVSVSRNRLDVGETGRDGRRLVTNLQAYRSNAIRISADDLPIDRAPASPVQRVTPGEGRGVIVRFADAQEQLIETRVAFEDGSTPPRGAILTRARDQRRFPVGSNGRVVLQGARAGDVLALGGCSASADEGAASAGLILACAAAS